MALRPTYVNDVSPLENCQVSDEQCNTEMLSIGKSHRYFIDDITILVFNALVL